VSAAPPSFFFPLAPPPRRAPAKKKPKRLTIIDASEGVGQKIEHIVTRMSTSSGRVPVFSKTLPTAPHMTISASFIAAGMSVTGPEGSRGKPGLMALGE
jgi:hypothetical protein